MSQYGIYWGDQLLRKDAEQKTPLVDGLLWEKDTVMLIGDAKVGKSLFTLQMACALTTGEPFMDMYDVPRAVDVLYLQLEGTREETQDRLHQMMRAVDCEIGRFTHVFHHGMALDTQRGFSELYKLLEEHKRTPSVIFIDPLFMAMDGDMKDSTASKLFIQNIRILSERYHAATIVVHHKHRSPRGEGGWPIDEGDRGYFGSFVWQAFPDHMFMLKCNKKEKLYTLTCSTQRSAKVTERVEFKLIENPLRFTRRESPLAENSYKITAVLREAGEGLSREDIMEKVGIKKSCFHDLIAPFLTTGEIYKKTGCRPVLYFHRDAKAIPTAEDPQIARALQEQYPSDTEGQEPASGQ